MRAITRQRGSFPDQTSALKVLYLQVKRRKKDQPGRTGGTNAGLNVLTPTYGERLQVN